MSKEALEQLFNCHDLRELWSHAKIYQGIKPIENAKRDAKNGIVKKWDINYYIQERFTIKGDTVFLEDANGTQLHFITEWCDEIDERENRLKSKIYEYESDDETTEAR